MQDDNPQLKSPSLDLPHFSFEKDAIVEKTKEMLWPLSNPDYWHIGKIVVFKTELVEGEGPDDEDVLLLKAVTVRPEDFAKLLWCNVAVHKRVRYGERVELLGYGRFNGRNGW
jgi:hypothetical protein